MNTNFTLDALVNASSGLFFVGIGIGALVLARRARVALAVATLAVLLSLLLFVPRPDTPLHDGMSGVVILPAVAAMVIAARRASRATLIGAFSLAFGGEKVVTNLIPPFWGPDFWGLVAGTVVIDLQLASVVAAAFLALDLVKGVPTSRAKRAVWFGVITATALSSIVVTNVVWHLTIGPDFDLPSTTAVLQAVSEAVLIAVSSLAFVAAAHNAKKDRSALAALALAFGLTSTLAAGVTISNLASPPDPGADPTAVALGVAEIALFEVPIILASLLWLRAIKGDGSRLACVVLLALLAATLIGLVIGALPRDFGVYGIFRTFQAALLVIAILKWDLLKLPIPNWTIRGGTLGLMALAPLFIVAQVAQNFLASQYGLLLGGIVAGAFLFAAHPVQRFIEDRGRREPRSRSTPSAIEAYRAALRAAIEDGAMTAREEDHLADVAHHLGLDHRDALRVRRQVEEEFRQS